ncbi:MAG: L,D-transpeptidase [Bacillota bacterium]|nr:L,D-transpeptidase [Bacillota bacterium]
MLKILARLAIVFALFVFPYEAHAKTPDQLILINKKINQLAFFENGKLVKVYPVATGRIPKFTPEGTFFIREMIKNRPYYKLHIKGGDPKNPLGDRWMGLSYNEHGSFPYGIHGTNNEHSIGKYASGGCIRMKNKDVRELFGRLHVHTKVVITTSKSSMVALAQPYLKKLVAGK